MASLPCDDQLPAVFEEPLPLVAQTASEGNSYGQILKSSALIGGSSVLNIAIGIMRTKVMAMLLGPAGFGLVGLYSSVADLTQNLAGMGINSSGVRQIAEAVGSEDTNRIAQTVAVLRRTSIVLGAAGAALLVAFSRQISVLTFGTDKHAGGISLLSVAVFCKLVSGGQGALIQGMRRIADLAKMNVLGTLFGAFIGLGLVYAFGENGIVSYIVAVAALGVLTSWWYSRKIRVAAPRVHASQIKHEAAALLKLGFAFMVSSMMTLGVAYAVRVTLLHRVGLQATGLYQCAWTFGGLYVGFILQAMAADFYPRLTANIADHDKCNRLVNEQALVGLLLAGPGVLATLTFAPAVIALLYSAQFNASVAILRWICLGTMMQVVTWPIGFIIVAAGKQNLFIFCEVAWAIVSLGLAWTCIGYFGMNGAGVAYFLSYVFHALLLYPIVRRLSGFTWSVENIRTAILFFSTIAIVFSGFYLLPVSLAVTLGGAAAAFTGVYAFRVLAKVVPAEDLPRPIRRLLNIVGLLHPRPATVD